MHECLGNPIIVNRVCIVPGVRSSASCFRRPISWLTSRDVRGVTGPSSGGFLLSFSSQPLYATISSGDEEKDNEGGPSRGTAAPDLLGAEMPRKKSSIETCPFAEVLTLDWGIIPTRSSGLKPMRDIIWASCCGSMVGGRKESFCAVAPALHISTLTSC